MNEWTGVVDVIARITSRGSLAIVINEGKEVYRSWDRFPTAAEAMKNAMDWAVAHNLIQE